MKNALIILADEFEEIEAVSTIDILRRAEINVVCAGLSKLNIEGSHGITIAADKLLRDIDTKLFDIVILPGGPGTKFLAESDTVISILQEFQQNNKYIAAICAAPTVLAKADVIGNNRVTSYPGTEDVFNKMNYSHDKTVISGNIITGRGPAAAVDFALAIVKTILSKEKEEQISQAIIR